MSLVHAVEGRPRLRDADLREVAAALRRFLLDNRAVLDIDPDQSDREVFELTTAQLAELGAILQREGPAGRQLARAWLRRVQTRPARIFLAPVEQLVQRVAERRGKRVALQLRGLDTPVDVGQMGAVLQAVPHLLRNAVDHGIEAEEARGDKPPVGQLLLVVGEVPGGYAVVIGDDGRGIDTARLARRAVAAGALTEAEAAALPEDERLQLIFRDGLSTAEEVSEISGRGVGMGAVWAAVQASGGHLDIRSEPGRGTRVAIFVPHAPDPAVAPRLSAAPRLPSPSRPAGADAPPEPC